MREATIVFIKETIKMATALNLFEMIESILKIKLNIDYIHLNTPNGNTEF